MISLLKKLNAKRSTLKVSAGFTILYAVLVATLLLSISMSIYNISYKQYILASSAVDSQVAVYAADAGLECALYWDGQSKDASTPPNVGDVFGSPDNSVNFSLINCNDE